jgi:hypothetical protein
MFALAHRGQAPAKGILHTEERVPARDVLGPNGLPEKALDPRGYWAGQHTNPTANEWRRLKARIGARQAIKQRKLERRAAKSTRFEV